MIINDMIAEIKNVQRMIILPHINADGDAVGAAIALCLALKLLGKEALVVLEEEMPSIYSFLKWQENTTVFEAQTDYSCDIVITVDTGDIKRLGKRAAIFNACDTTFNIDHHQTNDMFAKFNYVNEGSSATGEIVYQMIKMMGLDLNKDIAECLYTSIVTDTGGFRYSNTTGITHQIAADLINNGVQVAELSERIFEITSKEKVILTGAAIQSLEICEGGKVALVTLSQNVFDTIGAKDEDCGGIVNIARNIQGVEVAAMMRSKGDGVKVNLRSKSYVDVATLAEVFDGGGHKRASGFYIKDNIGNVKDQLMTEIRKIL